MSADFGQSWTENSNTGYFKSVSESGSGQYKTAIAQPYNGTQIFTSTDYGATWTMTISTDQFQCVSQSITGQYITMIGAYIRVSRDYGQTWLKKGEGGYGWSAVSMR
jgi:photosystem II stability/assembly factor-like uncharacterized protein